MWIYETLRERVERIDHLDFLFVRKGASFICDLQRANIRSGKKMCVLALGARDSRSIMKVDVMHGVFQKDPQLRNELFMKLNGKYPNVSVRDRWPKTW